jgi:hypothetical protein
MVYFGLPAATTSGANAMAAKTPLAMSLSCMLWDFIPSCCKEGNFFGQTNFAHLVSSAINMEPESRKT